jgi:hypothetical protein
MNWQLFFKINALVNQVVLMMMDGRITSSEAMQLVNMGLQMADISINPGEYYTFKEQDGDFHIILKKALLDKLHLEL